MEGWVKIPRELMEDKAYFTKPFTWKEAVLDLYLLAAIKDGNVTLNGKNYEVKCGQIITTTRYLVERWGWSKGGLDHFLRGAHFGAHFGAVSNSAFTCISVKNMSENGETWGTNWGTKQGATPILNKNVYLEEFIIDTRAREDRLEKEAQQLADDQVWLESIMMNHHIPPDGIPPLLSAFVTECKCNGLDSHGSIADTKRHFNSWLRIKLKEKHEQGTRNRPSPEENLRAAEWAAAIRTAQAIRGTNKIADDLPKPF